MIEKIVDAVTAELKKYLQKQMGGVEKKLDRINNRLDNIEAYMELRGMIDRYELMLSKHDNSDMDDVLKPPQTLKKPQTRRPGQ
jgi:hypothetical protein